MLSLCCSVGFSQVLASRGYSLDAVHGLLTAVAFLVVGHRLQSLQASVVAMCGLSSCSSRAPEHRLSSCGIQASLLLDMWNLPKPGVQPGSLTLAGRFLTTEPPVKPSYWFLMLFCHVCNLSLISWTVRDKVVVLVAQLCLTLCDPVDCSLPDSSVHSFQARILEWVAISFSRWSSQPRDHQTKVPFIPGRCFTVWATRDKVTETIKIRNLKSGHLQSIGS